MISPGATSRGEAECLLLAQGLIADLRVGDPVSSSLVPQAAREWGQWLNS